jgi:hypothetical protein
MKALVLVQMLLLVIACVADEAATASRSTNDLAQVHARACPPAAPGGEVPAAGADGTCLFGPANSR